MSPSIKREDEWIGTSLDKNVEALEKAIKKGKKPFKENPEFWQKIFLKVAKSYIFRRNCTIDDGK